MVQFNEYMPGILLLYAAFGLGLVTPGPNILAVIGTSMSVNRKSGVALAAGVAGGTFLWATLAVMGVAALFATFASALFVLKIVGGLYLLWLAYKIFRSAASTDALEITSLQIANRGPLGYVARGVIIQMSNPKAALAWLAILPLCIDNGAPPWVWMAVVIGTTTMSVLGHLAYAIAFSTRPAIDAFHRGRRVMQTLLGCFFGFVGIKLLVSGL